MGRTNKEQDEYDYLHNKPIPKNRLFTLLRYFNRVNFWDWDLKIKSRQHKDAVRGGESRVKKSKFK